MAAREITPGLYWVRIDWSKIGTNASVDLWRDGDWIIAVFEDAAGGRWWIPDSDWAVDPIEVGAWIERIS
jgi:hypothetical protein